MWFRAWLLDLRRRNERPIRDEGKDEEEEMNGLFVLAWVNSCRGTFGTSVGSEQILLGKEQNSKEYSK